MKTAETIPFPAQLRQAIGRRTIRAAAEYAGVNPRTFSQWVIGRRTPCLYVQKSVLERLKTLPKRKSACSACAQDVNRAQIAMQT